MPRLSCKDRTLPVAITNIKLGSALQDCGAVGVIEAFDKSSAPQLFVYDDNDLGYTDWKDTTPDFVAKCFLVKNPNGAVIVLLPLDGRIITGRSVSKGGVCDSMLLTEKEMSLIEFKTNVISTSYQTIRQRALEGITQLWHTYNAIIEPRCMKFSKNLRLLSVDFYIVFNRELEVVGINSELMDLQNEFFENNKRLLYFGNEKTFE